MPSDQPNIQSCDMNTNCTREVNGSYGPSMNIIGPNLSQTSPSNTLYNGETVELAFSSKGLHVANLNVWHLLSKLDEIGIILASENGPDILGTCETYLDSSTPDSLISVADYEFLRKDRGCTIYRRAVVSYLF